jgi:CRP/FNR family cyclic AMP-dependent transcriptional regulator
MDAAKLRPISLFSTLTDEELSAIAPFAEEVSVSAGTELVKEGDFSYQFFAIDSGEAEVTRSGEHLADLGPGDFFGEIGLLERDLRNASVTAKTDMHLVTLTGWDMKRMEKRMPHAVERIREVIEERRSG